MSKYTEEYLILDRQGNQLGPKQIFEAETPEEMISKLKGAHQNAAAKLYETKLAVKLGTMLEPDSDQPIQTFQEKSLSADELVKVNTLLKDPKTAPDAYKTLLEAQFGAPVDVIRKILQQTELNNRVETMREHVELFKYAHPEYVDSETNKEKMLKFLDKKKWPITKKNLELAYEELGGEGLLVTQTPIPAVAAQPAPSPVTSVPEPVAPAVPTLAAAPALPSQPEIPAVVTPAAPISAVPAEVRSELAPSLSSTGLGRSNGVLSTPPEPPKAKGITRAELAKMTSTDYERKLRLDPEFVKSVEALLKS